MKKATSIIILLLITSLSFSQIIYETIAPADHGILNIILIYKAETDEVSIILKNKDDEDKVFYLFIDRIQFEKTIELIFKHHKEAVYKNILNNDTYLAEVPLRAGLKENKQYHEMTNNLTKYFFHRFTSDDFGSTSSFTVLYIIPSVFILPDNSRYKYPRICLELETLTEILKVLSKIRLDNIN